MQLVKVVLHGGLKGRYPSFAVAGGTAAEVLEGWGRQVGLDRLPAALQPIVHVAGHQTDEQLNAPLQLAELHLVPSLFGGGGGFGKIIIGGLQIVAGLLIMPINPMIGTALIVGGITTALMGVVELFMKSPSLSKEEDPEASKYIGTGRNTTAIGTPIGFGGGRMKIGGHIMSLQVNSTDLVHGTFPATPT